jgi:molecular chaperone HtpG
VTDTQTKETLTFQTEAKQLLQLMIHSLYSNKEIFLRELVSNASDACDKLRFEALTETQLLEEDSELAIHLHVDTDARTITVTDNGVGMSRQEVIEQIGTIAKSGTREFVETLTGDQAKDAQLIGQFGVGFYSSFIVADRVTLTTRRAGLTPTDAVRWESSGEGDYTLESVSKDSRGTEVTLHLREDEDELLSGHRIRTILHKYSDHITIPIFMPKEAPPSEDSSDSENATDTAGSSEIEKVNQASALWTRAKSEITKEQYHEFYKHVAHDFSEPLTYTHARVEGRQEYTVLFYIPQQAPFDLFERDQRHGIKLYVRRVFIMDGAEQLMPGYLRFVKGLIDSNDLPLNVSREILQHSRDVEAMKTASAKRVLGLLEDLAKNEPSQYETFWKEFGRVLKEGVGEDLANKERIGGLLRFATTHHDNNSQTVSLAEYVDRMKDGQDSIYYITADSFSAAQHSPHLEIFRKKNVEVLLLHDRVDEWLVAHLNEFNGKTLQSVTKGDLNLGELASENVTAEVEAKKKTADDFKPLLERIQQALGDKAKEVRLTDRLTESPACLVTEQDGMSANLERVLRAAGQAVPDVPLVLEINAEHPIVVRLKDETDDSRFADWSHILFDQAMLAEGGQLTDPAAFVTRLNALMLTMAGGPKSKIWTPGS